MRSLRNENVEIKKNELYGHTDRVHCLVLLPDNSLASGSWVGTIIIWDIKSEKKNKHITSMTG